ncbi:BZ3500_MvSof-1268-A1-R1_Chr4-2g07121 [Microbotryum saponariae]|uniref:BZ3500_MvSof-1268-A1-R1_Chr4-2g07121 protein n=1 Tax=Microbotryum saponariae TaxID=289078 RepID=A0A2X0KXW3_9BASI|nr:BZ3500_MvSof-1268-A1-R1_Chr4-2g07121 [Microbotryum saponariae]SDA06786.1 BZ3501_MvSof-1269-A2-R1_Chr4-2g06832 [Microbotryum saponariae]
MPLSSTTVTETFCRNWHKYNFDFTIFPNGDEDEYRMDTDNQGRKSETYKRADKI